VVFVTCNELSLTPRHSMSHGSRQEMKNAFAFIAQEGGLLDDVLTVDRLLLIFVASGAWRLLCVHTLPFSECAENVAFSS
jgi:hypothetical protein